MLGFLRRVRRKLLDEGQLRKYLIYAIGEILLITIGILVALQVDNRNENQKNRALEGEYIARLLENVRADRESYQYISNQLLAGEESSREVLKLLNLNLLNEVDQDELVSLVWGAATHQRSPDYHKGTYNELLSTGRISLIRSNEIRQKLADYHRSIEQLSGIFTEYPYSLNLWYAGYVPPEITYAFWLQCSDRKPFECRIDLGEWLPGEMIKSLATNPQIKPWLQIQISRQYRGQWAINSALDPHASDLESLLEEELEIVE